MNRWFRRLIQRSFNFCQRRGFHVVLNDFLSPIPDTRKLDDNLWLNPPDITGLDLDNQKMLNLLATFKQKYQNEYNLFPTHETHNPGQYYLNQTWFSTVDAEILYCMIRSLKPQKIIEVGSGFPLDSQHRQYTRTKRKTATTTAA